MPRIVLRIAIFEAERTDSRHLRNVFARLRPMEMPGLARQDDDASRRIGRYPSSIERLAEPDVEDSRHYGVDPIFWMLVRHQDGPVRHLHPDDVRAALRGLANHDSKTRSRRKCRERLPLNIFGKD